MFFLLLFEFYKLRKRQRSSELKIKHIYIVIFCVPYERSEQYVCS